MSTTSEYFVQYVILLYFLFSPYGQKKLSSLFAFVFVCVCSANNNCRKNLNTSIVSICFCSLPFRHERTINKKWANERKLFAKYGKTPSIPFIFLHDGTMHRVKNGRKSRNNLIASITLWISSSIYVEAKKTNRFCSEKNLWNVFSIYVVREPQSRYRNGCRFVFHWTTLQKFAKCFHCFDCFFSSASLLIWCVLAHAFRISGRSAFRKKYNFMIEHIF